LDTLPCGFVFCLDTTTNYLDIPRALPSIHVLLNDLKIYISPRMTLADKFSVVLITLLSPMGPTKHYNTHISLFSLYSSDLDLGFKTVPEYKLFSEKEENSKEEAKPREQK
jgi:hypothetical protein